MLRQDEENFLVEKLTIQLSQRDGRATLAGVLPGACMSKIRYCTYPAEYAAEAIRVCASDGWDHDPAWIVLLFRLFIEDPRIVEIRNRVSVPPNTPSPNVAYVLASEAPFVDRQDLRKKIEVIGRPRPARPILVVTGATKSGKSYTREYVDHLRVSGGNFDYCHVSLPKGMELSCGPEELARDMLTRMGVEMSRLPPSFFDVTTNKERWPFDLAGRVLSEGRKDGETLWIVLDRFVGTDVRKDTLRFIDSLAQHIVESSKFRDAYRLLLLDFDRSQLTVDPGKVEAEAIGSFGKADVMDCVSEIFCRHQQVKTREDIALVVEHLLKGLPNGAERMSELNQRLTDLMQQLRENSP